MYVVLLEKNTSTFPKLRLAISGGAAMPVEVLRQAKDILKLPVVEGYGLTESSPVVGFNPLNGIQKAGSLGVPLHGVKCIIADDNEMELQADKVGELITFGDNVMLGYHNKDKETAEVLKIGWLRL